MTTRNIVPRQDDDEHISSLENEARVSFKECIGANFLRDANSALPDYRDFEHLFHILQKYPSLAKEKYHDNYIFPLHIMLVCNAPIETIQEVYAMYPDAVKEPDFEGQLPLHYALIRKCSFDVISFLMEKYPTAASVDMCSSVKTSQSHRSNNRMPRTKQIPIIHVIDHWHWSSDDENKDLFIRVIQLLYNAFPPEDSKHPYPKFEWRRSLGKIINTTEIPKELLIWLAKIQKIDSECYIHLLTVATEIEITLENLRHFIPALGCNKLDLRLDTSGRMTRATRQARFIIRLLSEVNIPSTVEVKLSNFYLNLPTDLDVAGMDWSSCQLKSLCLCQFAVAPESCDQLFNLFRALPNLKELYLFGRDPTGMKTCSTDQLIDLLESRNFELIIDADIFNIKVPELSQALQTSNSTSLVWYMESTPTRFDPEIAYHSAMNHHGRTKVSASSATGTLLVDCLSSVEGKYDTSQLEQSVLYGLLRLAPGLWAVPGSGAPGGATKKRPRDDSLLLVPQPGKKKMK